jgi:hypothetical protein
MALVVAGEEAWLSLIELGGLPDGEDFLYVRAFGHLRFRRALSYD